MHYKCKIFEAVKSNTSWALVFIYTHVYTISDDIGINKGK